VAHRWLPISLALAGAVALAFAALLRWAELAAVIGDAAAPLLVGALGPAIVCVVAAVASWLIPAARRAAGGAMVAVAAITGWSALWGLAHPEMIGSAATVVGALLLGPGGVLLLGQPGADRPLESGQLYRTR
jgi:hypothetical protein